MVTSSSFTDGESGALPDPNATFSFSAPAGVGNTVAVSFRYVLDDGALTIALTRMRSDPRTREYVAKRTAQGLSKREIMRCLKR
jgi:hypothetical protein